MSGRGVVRDEVQAHMWMNLAAATASGDDHERYAEGRDRLAGRMHTTQIVEAQRLARDWKPVQDK
jgi:hypothetical protein